VFPDSLDAADGWLVTGSKYSAYEDLDWIRQLEEFIRKVYAANKPMVGICFGHQIMAKALGGTVEKFPGGWVVGKQNYRIEGIGDSLDLLAWHQDQVTVLPKGARVVGTSPSCQFAAITYGDFFYSVQPHPEMTTDFVTDLFEARKDVLPKKVMERRHDDHGEPINAPQLARKLAHVLKAGAQK